MFTITCIAIIGMGACYTGFHAWALLGELRADTSLDARANKTDLSSPSNAACHDEQPFGVLTNSLAALLPETRARRLIQTVQLEAAGLHSKSAWASFNAIRCIMVFASFVTVLACLIVVPENWERTVFALLILVPIAAWTIPGLWLASKANQRTKEIEQSLPDLLDLLNMGVSQGLPVSSVISNVAPALQEAHPAISQELVLVHHQSQISCFNYAFERLASRFDSEWIQSFSSLLIQSETTGTSISTALSDYSNNIRKTLRQQLATKTNAASIKLLFPVTLCLLPSVFLFLMGPAIIDVDNFLTKPDDVSDSFDNSQPARATQQTLVVPLGN